MRPTTWTFLGYLPIGIWRFGIVPLNGGQSNQELVFAENNVLMIPTPLQNGTYDLTAISQFSTGVWDPWNFPKYSMQTAYVYWNMAASTVAAQAGNGIVLTYPNEISRPGPIVTPLPLPSPKAAPTPYRTPGPFQTFVPKPSYGGYFPPTTIDDFGYRVYYFDLGSQSFSAMPPVLPVNLARQLLRWRRLCARFEPRHASRERADRRRDTPVSERHRSQPASVRRAVVSSSGPVSILTTSLSRKVRRRHSTRSQSLIFKTLRAFTGMGTTRPPLATRRKALLVLLITRIRSGSNQMGPSITHVSYTKPNTQ